MKVETYEVQEVVQCVGEQAEVAKGLAAQLGCTGQEQFYESGKPTIAPYRKMTAQERIVYEALLTRKTKLKTYADSPVPVRVLQVALHAEQVLDGCELYVWHPANADDKDPLLVANVKNPAQTLETWYYILARWGDELDEWSVLLDRAKKVIAAEARASLLKIKGEVDAALTNVEAAVEAKLLKGEAQQYSFYN